MSVQEVVLQTVQKFQFKKPFPVSQEDSKFCDKCPSCTTICTDLKCTSDYAFLADLFTGILMESPNLVQGQEILVSKQSTEPTSLYSITVGVDHRECLTISSSDAGRKPFCSQWVHWLIYLHNALSKLLGATYSIYMYIRIYHQQYIQQLLTIGGT